MAPIPVRIPSEAHSLISAAERRYRHLNEVEIPNLRNCTGPLVVQQTLAEELRGNTVLLARQIEDLEMMVDDLQGEKNRRELRGIVDDLKTKFESVRTDSRTALLTSKRNIESRNKSNRDELLSSNAPRGENTLSEKSSDDALMKANSDVTDALRRTIALMQTELERSVLTTQILDSSTASLRSTSLQHDTLSSVMTTSKQLITALEKADWLDRMLIFSGFFFFLLVVLFILKQRIVDRGLRIAFWWTRFLPDFSDDQTLLKDAEGGMLGVVGEASTLAATVVSSLSLASPVSGAFLSGSSISHPPNPTLMDIPTSTFSLSETVSSPSSIPTRVEHDKESPTDARNHEEL